jgi:processing peptidase subunit alpha
MHNATAYNHAYADSGVFCIHASSHPSQLRELVDVITRELVAMAGIIEHSELSVGANLK